MDAAELEESLKKLYRAAKVSMEETGPVAVQSAGTLLGLRLMMTVLPMLVLAGALVLFRRKFVLTDARAAEISAQLHGEETHHD